MTRRTIIASCCALVACGVVAPLAAVRAHRARLVEAAMSHAVLFTRHLALRAAPALRAGRVPPLDLTPWSQEPGVAAVWISDRDGRVVASRGPVGPAGTMLAGEALAAGRFIARPGANGEVVLAMRAADESDGAAPAQAVGAVGCRFFPLRAARAMGAPAGVVWYLLGWAAIGAMSILWGIRLRQALPPEVRGPRRGARPGESARCPPSDQAIADCFPQPTLILDAQHRLLAANAAASERGWAGAAHFLDLAETVPWGKAALELLDAAAQSPGATAHGRSGGNGMDFGLSVARREEGSEVTGYWVVIHGAGAEANT